MNDNKFQSAREAAISASPLAQQWELYFGELCDREELVRYGECLDAEKALDDGGCYVLADDGALGYSVDNGKHVQWLATVTTVLQPEAQMTITETPWQVIKGELKSKARGLRQLLTVKGMTRKLMFMGIMMLIMWVGTMVWQRICANNGSEAPFIVRLLAYLTFADGGVNSNIFFMIGGLLGKMFVMGALFAVLLGGVKRTLRGLVGFICSPFSISTKSALACYMAGMGVACVLYNFFTGNAALHLSMAGVAGFLSMLWGIGGGQHFTRRMTVAMTAHVNRQSRVHYQNLSKAATALSGLALGFLLSIALSTIDWGFTPYCVGALCLLMAVILPLVKLPAANTQKPQETQENQNAHEAHEPQEPQVSDEQAKTTSAAATVATAVVLALLMWPAHVQADDWYLEFERVENVKNSWADTEIPANRFVVETGRHEENYTYIKHQDEISVSLCPYPPTIIKKNDKVTLDTQSKSDAYVAVGYNADRNGNPNPPYDKIYQLCGFEDDGRVAHTITNRPYSLVFDEYFAGGHSVSDNITDGEELAIVFHTLCGETRWIYRFHNGEEPKPEGWYLQLVRTENYTLPEQKDKVFYVSTGNHRYTAGENYLYHGPYIFVCSTPPAVIHQNDRVTLTLSNVWDESVSFCANRDKDYNPNPPCGQLFEMLRFVDSNGWWTGQNNTEPVQNGETRDVGRVLDYEYLVGGDGAEFVLVFQSPAGETRWIYQYHSGEEDDEELAEEEVVDSAEVIVVEVDEEGNVVGKHVEKIPKKSDGSYSGVSDGEMAGAIGGTAVAVVIVLVGAGAAGGGGGAPEDDDKNGGAPNGSRPSDRYVKPLPDGTIEYTNPVTGEVDYRPAEEEENLREGVETVLRNPDYFKDAQDKHDKFVEDDRRRVQQEIERRKNEHDEYVKRKEAEEKEFWRKYNQAHKLKGKYLAIDDEGEGDDIYKSLRRSMVEKQGEWGAESWAEQSKADYIDGYQMANKAVKDVADTGMDMAAEYGGGGYKVFRDVYKAGAEMTQTLTDAAIRGKSLPRAAVVGMARAGITWLQYHTEGQGTHLRSCPWRRSQRLHHRSRRRQEPEGSMASSKSGRMARH